MNVIVTYGHSREENDFLVKEVLERLGESNMKLNISGAQFVQTEVKLLEVTLNGKGIKLPEIKTN